MQQELIIDTGFFVALLYKSDAFHKKALQLRKKIEQRKWITTWPVLTEVCHLLAARGAQNQIAVLLQMLEKGGFSLFHLYPEHICRLLPILQKYNNLPIDLADASLVLLAEEIGHGTIVSTDLRDFETYRWKSRKPFHNLFTA